MTTEPTSKAVLSPAALFRRALGRAFRRDQSGAVAVEFALLALPFFAIIAAILETAFFFFASQILDSAVDNSVRFLRTGQAAEASYEISDFRDAICDRLFGLFDCNKLQIEVNTVTSFSDASFELPLDPDTYEWKDMWDDPDLLYKPGGGNDIVTVRVYYKWPTMFDILGFNLSNAGEGFRLLAAVRVFQNEPFAAGGGS